MAAGHGSLQRIASGVEAVLGVLAPGNRTSSLLLPAARWRHQLRLELSHAGGHTQPQAPQRLPHRCDHVSGFGPRVGSLGKVHGVACRCMLQCLAPDP